MTTTITTEVLSLNQVFQKQSINNAWVSDATILVNQGNGWNVGGYSGGAISTVQGINYALDTSNTSIRGALSTVTQVAQPLTNPSYGWITGGRTAGLAVSNTQKITYATDTATAVQKGLLAIGACGGNGVGNLTNGWITAVENSVNVYITNIQGITYATDTTVASLRGNLTTQTYAAGAADTSVNGWFAGGYYDALSVTVSLVQGITYATDTGLTSQRGNLAIAVLAVQGLTTGYNGWFAGGGGVSGASYVQKITFANDTATAIYRGNLNIVSDYNAGVGNSNNGWVLGGYNSAVGGNGGSYVQRITYATDTAVASLRGNLTTGTYNSSGV